LIDQSDVPDRNFAAWTMGFRDLSKGSKYRVEGYADVFEKKGDIADLVKHKDMAVGLLTSFCLT
jgi:hypothetical protein